MSEYESDARWIEARAEAMASERTDSAADRVLDGIRATVRQMQVELLHEPDPDSPWWFLVDPNTT